MRADALTAQRGLRPGDVAIISSRGGTFDLEVTSLDAYGISGHVMNEPGGKEHLVLFPWAAVTMITWASDEE